MFWVYIIHNPITDRYYIGYSEDPDKRLAQHNEGINKSTKSGAPDWEIIYKEDFPTRSEALRREKSIKARKSKKFIESLVTSKKSD
jgi:putative endonuclease